MVDWRYSECLKNADRERSRSNMLHSILPPEKYAVESACVALDHIYLQGIGVVGCNLDATANRVLQAMQAREDCAVYVYAVI